jgi:hypothetical protein
MLSHKSLMAAVRAYVKDCYQDDKPVRVVIQLESGGEVSLPVTKAPIVEAEWVPSSVQLAILQALEGKIMTADALAATIGCDRTTLYTGGAIQQLMDRGFVKNSRKLGGYYRPSHLPEAVKELTERT